MNNRSKLKGKTCPVVIMVGHHASPGTITDRPKVRVERVHAGGEAAEVLPVELPSEALHIMEIKNIFKCLALLTFFVYLKPLPASAEPTHPTCLLSPPQEHHVVEKLPLVFTH